MAGRFRSPYGIILDEDGPKMSETTPTEVPSTQTPSTTVATSEAVTEPPVEITPTYNNRRCGADRSDSASDLNSSWKWQ